MAHVVAPLGRAYSPALILVSAGYDAHADDPLGSCLVSDGGYATMGALMRDLAASLRVPVGLVLEGGYDVDALARSVVATLEVLGGSAGEAGAAAAPEPAVHPLAEGAVRRLAAGRWGAAFAGV